ncbi:peptide ABC transporter permease [Heyndrickxia sporothermodurans]|uniref:ABC transporter permease n=1 Tax=Heyndrickxia TaxID=2837504 RepID=UPI000D3B825A|nr:MULTISPECIES: ABC transporter permease [Heyndrickxia]MED3652644.1 ABC transporter permease [Heyndrickxia sporothermodurans]MED3699013.1 ABC transporter permease [Heyndrickxia sporothermodurans]MED3779336.1 ABC transporter permease [Heyndrickxia sporothermodurans]PTY78529.1 peptide ABC transporter permease [Heyndrickxia sporothermodurans]PTY84587.1 peptide ABC transporter permease [Heyndrickxia sporothermodurans]
MYILKRFFTMILTIWVIATLTFVIMKLIPGDPFASDADVLPQEVLENIRANYNLDKPIPVQYVLYLKSLVTLDLGPSIQSKTRTVNDIIASGFPASATLGLQSIVIALIFGLLLGIIAALNHNRFLDYTAMVIAIIGISIPSFILAPLLIKFFAVKWGILPVASWGTWQHTILPSIALATTPLAVVARFMRSSMIDVMNQNYIKTADAKGLTTTKLVFKHGIRNAILPVVTFIGPLFVSLITGTFVIEKIFAIPGIGRYFVDSIFNRDYPVIMGTTVFFSVILVVTLFLIDISYRLIDPRIKLTSKGD